MGPGAGRGRRPPECAARHHRPSPMPGRARRRCRAIPACRAHTRRAARLRRPACSTAATGHRRTVPTARRGALLLQPHTPGSLPATVTGCADLIAKAVARRPRPAAERNRHRRRPRKAQPRPIDGLATGLRHPPAPVAPAGRLPADALATERLAEEELRALLPRPGRAETAATARQPRLAGAGTQRLATPGRGAQPGIAAGPVPPPPGTLAAARSRAVAGRTGLPRPPRQLLPERTHSTKSAAARRAASHRRKQSQVTGNKRFTRSEQWL